MVEGRGALGLVEAWNEVHQAGDRGQPAEPPLAAAKDAEVDPRPEQIEAARIGFEQGDRRLRQHERDVALQPVFQPLALVTDRILARAQVDEHVVPVQSDREAAQLVRELVERPAGRQIEARVMPVAGEDPVADRAPVEREAHVRAPVVDGVHLLALREQAERVAVEVDDEAAFRAQLLERGGADGTVCCDGGHALLLLHQKRGSSGSAAPTSSRLTPRYCSSVNEVWAENPTAESENVSG